MSSTVDPRRGGPIQGPVVGQYFGLFHGCSKEHFDRIVSTAPFDCCNLLILGFTGLSRFNPEVNVVELSDHRDNEFNGGQATPDDTDDRRIRLVVNTARAMNPTIKILISLGWYNQVVKASQTPGAFASSLAVMVDMYRLDGFDIDWEDTADAPLPDPFGPSDFAKLMGYVKEYLGGLMPEPILTLCPAFLYRKEYPMNPLALLDKSVLDCFTYVMPQSYNHGGNDTRVMDYALMLGDGRTPNFDKIVYGLGGEGYLNPADKVLPDDPTLFVQNAKNNKAAGVFSWRLDTDSMLRKQPEGQQEGRGQLPTFDVARKMWQLMRG